MRKVWLILLIAILASLLGFEGVKFFTMSTDRNGLWETARLTLASEVAMNRLLAIRQPGSPRSGPETETRIKQILVKRGMELHIPVGEKDIALWQDSSKVYCRVAWTQERKIFGVSIGSVLYDRTVEVSRP